MTDTDLSHRFTIEDSPVRGELVQLDSTYKTIMAKHNYPLELERLLGQMMAAAVLLSSTLKFEGMMIIQARGNGPLSLATVECTHQKALRAVAQWEGDLSGQAFSQLMQGAHLAITIAPQNGERYQGIVPLERDSLAGCLEDYFERSEQLRTRLWLAEGDQKAAGLMMQFMPYNSEVNTPESELTESWVRVTTLADTLTQEEQLSLAPEELLYRLFHEEGVRLQPAQTVCFHCPCSRERFASSLLVVPQDELNDILAEQGNIETQCQFCNERYVFDAVDIANLFATNSQPGSPNAH